MGEPITSGNFERLQPVKTFKIVGGLQRALPQSADDPAAGALLRELVPDAEDTAVTLAALTERGDRAGLGILAGALATADDQQGDWIGAGSNRSKAP